MPPKQTKLTNRSTKPAPSRPRIRSDLNTKTTTIHHTEHIAQLVAGNSFDPYPLGINPCNRNMFPWLSTLAESFETYRFTRLVLKYVPSCPSTTDGRIYFAVDYDSNDAPYSNVREFMSAPTSATNQISKHLSVNIPYSKMSNVIQWHYTNKLSTLAGRDRNFSDCGIFQFAAMSNSSVIAGDLLVSYSVELRQPQ